jgi:hypothetical protein
MLVSLYVAMFVVAGAATYIALTRRVDARLGGVVALALWARLTPAAFNLTVFSNGSQLSAPADTATAILTATLALLMLVFVFGAAFDAIPGREQTRFGSSDTDNPRQ